MRFTLKYTSAGGKDTDESVSVEMPSVLVSVTESNGPFMMQLRVTQWRDNSARFRQSGRKMGANLKQTNIVAITVFLHFYAHTHSRCSTLYVPHHPSFGFRIESSAPLLSDALPLYQKGGSALQALASLPQQQSESQARVVYL